MKIEIKEIGEIKLNVDNPRTISDDKFKKLVKSIKEFPEMLDIRPIVIDEDNVVLGGNMRLQACIKAGLKEIPTIKADSLTPEQKKEFILKDNQAFGEWDNTLLANWDKDMLLNSGFEVWDITGIFGDNEAESGYKKGLEGSNFNTEIVNVDDFIKQNILFFNEVMFEFEEDEIKKALRNIHKDSNFIEDVKKLILQYGK